MNKLQDHWNRLALPSPVLRSSPAGEQIVDTVGIARFWGVTARWPMSVN